MVEQVLFVCTGNICRSPMAEVVARQALSSDHWKVDFSSAGLLEPGMSPTEEALSVMSERGYDISSHKSRLALEAIKDPPDLIVALARRHLAAIVNIDASIFEKIFTLKELVRRVEAEEERSFRESLDDYLGRIGEGRRVWDIPKMRRSEDVEDPIGRSLKTYGQCADEIESLVRRMVARVWPG